MGRHKQVLVPHKKNIPGVRRQQLKSITNRSLSGNSLGVSETGSELSQCSPYKRSIYTRCRSESPWESKRVSCSSWDIIDRPEGKERCEMWLQRCGGIVPSLGQELFIQLCLEKQKGACCCRQMSEVVGPPVTGPLRVEVRSIRREVSILSGLWIWSVEYK